MSGPRPTGATIRRRIRFVVVLASVALAVTLFLTTGRNGKLASMLVLAAVLVFEDQIEDFSSARLAWLANRFARRS